jgi:dTMP kinase
MSEKRGRFITIEGTEGVGKSTVISAIHQALQSEGLSIMLTREPGGTPVAESIRRLFLSDHRETILPITELLLMFAARAQHVEIKIKPALARGEWVISDRFTDASFAYQGGGRGIAREKIQMLADWVEGFCVPDLTILLDASVEIGLERMAARGEKDRIEKEGLDFFESIRKSYLHLAKVYPHRFCVIDANQNEAAVITDVLAALSIRRESGL